MPGLDFRYLQTESLDLDTLSGANMVSETRKISFNDRRREYGLPYDTTSPTTTVISSPGVADQTLGAPSQPSRSKGESTARNSDSTFAQGIRGSLDTLVGCSLSSLKALKIKGKGQLLEHPLVRQSTLSNGIRRSTTIDIEYEDIRLRSSGRPTGQPPHLSPSASPRRLKLPIDLFLPFDRHAGWLKVLSAFLTATVTLGLNLSFGVYEEHYYDFQLLGQSHFNIAWIPSVQLSLIFLLTVPVGHYFKRGYGSWIFRIGVLILFAGQVALAFCGQYWHVLLAQGFLQGIGMAGMIICSLLTLAHNSPYRSPITTGIVASGASFGGLLFAMVEMYGFRTWRAQHQASDWKHINLLYVGVLLAGLLVLPLAAYTDEVRPVKSVDVENQRDQAIIRWRNKMLKKGLSPSRARNEGILNDRPFLLLVGGLLFTFAGLHLPYYFIISYATLSLRHGPDAAVKLLLLLLTASIVFRILPTLLSIFYFGPMNSLISCNLISVVVLATWVVIDISSPLVETSTYTAIWAVAILYGATSSGILGLLTSTIEAFDLKRDGPFGSSQAGLSARFDIAITACGVGILLGTPIGASMIGMRRLDGTDFTGGIGWAMACLLLGSVFFVAARVMKVGWFKGLI